MILMTDPCDRTNRIIVRIDSDLEELIPQYLKNRRRDVQSILADLESGDYQAIGVIGHSMRGSGGGYGFEIISRIGEEMELSADSKSAGQIRKSVEELSDYLDRVEVVYV